MKLSTRIITAVLIVAGGSGAVYAFNKHGDWGMTPEEKVDFVTERVTKKLELDSEQQQNFTSLAETVAGIMLEARQAKQQQMNEIGELLQDPSFNQARALEIVQQKTQMVNEKAPLVVSSLAVFLDSLSAEQKAQLQD
ncbi:MAG: periplasmic heavy metal sensor, partial [Gammaproteobacteria bacterium]|nr:periplasmic heavy metal sensor [Gammaproteobacteria bacterium]